MVRLVEVVLKPTKRACPPPSSAGALSGAQLSPGYAGAEAQGIYTAGDGRGGLQSGEFMTLYEP
jgi:hypothetical protein